MNYQLTLENKQVLNQSQIQSLEVLTMCNAELEEYLQNEYLENPLIECDERALDNKGIESTGWQERDFRNQREAYAVDIPVSTNKDWQKYLIEQLDPLAFSKAQWRVIHFLIECLDSNGYFNISTEEVADLTNTSYGLVEGCLDQLKLLEPHGIFSKDLSECLKIQLIMSGIEDQHLFEIIEHHLEDLSDGKISNITRKLNLSSLQVRKYIALIETLNPRPLMGLYTERNVYIVPDVLFEKTEQGWVVSINDNWYGNYKLNDYYLKMLKDTKDEEIKEYFKNKLERARMIFSNIEQRRRTIIQIGQQILELQQDYFEKNGELMPMTMADIANRLDIHTSTVSRAVKEKYVGYPSGTILMKSLFSNQVGGEMGEGNFTATQIKKEIKGLVKNENKKKPLSDQAIMESLKRKGIHISRRGIAKYREEMGIKGSYQRKTI